MSQIDARAQVAASARLGAGVRIGAFAVVGAEVEMGEGCVLHEHARVSGPARLGARNIVHPFASLGGDPQDLTYRGEPTELFIGDDNIFHEFVTVNRGTAKGGGATRIGNRNLFMAYAHIAHDCTIGNSAVFVNGATLAGHVTVEDFATVGAFCPVHQFCRIGKYSYIAAQTVITQDVAPFAKVVAPRETRCYGVNAIGLERNGFSRERIAPIERAYRLLLRSKLNTAQAVEQMRVELNGSADVAELIAFIETAERGLTK